jgi:DNA-directed RNA polymerase sigma subunit (sigma70/sigma32)
LERKLIKGVLHDLVGQLPKRLRQVIVGRYGLGEQPPCTLKERGKELGLSGERVRQLEQEVLAWLRHPAHSWHLRQLVGKNTAADYRRALAQNAALRRSRRQKP